MTFSALTNAGNYIASEVTCAKKTMCIKSLCKFLHFVGPDVISNGPNRQCVDTSVCIHPVSCPLQASIAQEMEQSVQDRLEKAAALETEVTTLKAAVATKEELIVSLETEVSNLREDLGSKDELIAALQQKPVQVRGSFISWL